MPLGQPPADLSRFPEYLLPARRPLYRVYRPDRGSPWWFSGSGGGRFDLLDGVHGTCYVAAAPIGAVVETLGRLAAISEEDANTRSVAVLACGRDLRIADLTNRRALGFRVTAEIHSTPDYVLPQTWAAALHARGFEGLRYRLSHDPSARLTGYALFDQTDDAASRWPPPVSSAGPALGDVARLARDFGVRVIPRP